MREACGIRDFHPICKTVNAQYDAFLSVKKTVQHLVHMHCLGEFHGHFIFFYPRSVLFFAAFVREGFCV